MAVTFPWYDSIWLESYVLAKRWVRKHRPAMENDFVRAFDVLRTNPGFEVQELRGILTPSMRAELKELCSEMSKGKEEDFEFQTFGRNVVQGHPLLNQFQAELLNRVSEVVGEPIEAHYNFLSLYSELGRCSVHMDSPEAKWTLDCCIEQSDPWPIQFSQAQPWPEDFVWQADDWEQQILEDPKNQFRSFTLQEGDGIVFSGSSQWHFRRAIPQASARPFCHLIFFHFIPAGTREIIDPGSWGNHFGIPELQIYLETTSAADDSED